MSEPMQPKLTCADVRPLLPLYPYGELSFNAEEAVDAHVEVCTACQAEKRTLEQMYRALDDRELAPSLELLSQCRRAVRNEVAVLAGAPAAVWEIPSLGGFLGAAGAAGFLGGGFPGRPAPHPAPNLAPAET